MASITFEGPNALGGDERITTAVRFDDSLMLLTVQSLCANYNYQPTIRNPEFDPAADQPETVPNPVGPGTFAIERIMDFCRDNVRKFSTEQAARDAAAAALAALSAVDHLEIERVP